jgi:hypothetical protein
MEFAQVVNGGTKAAQSAELRSRLVEIALEWQGRFGVAPHITSAISEVDAALLIGMSEQDYCENCKHRTAVTKGCDFTFKNCRYQVRANRPSEATFAA